MNKAQTEFVKLPADAPPPRGRVTFREGEHITLKDVAFTVSQITDKVMILRPVGQLVNVRGNGKPKHHSRKR